MRLAGNHCIKGKSIDTAAPLMIYLRQLLSFVTMHTNFFKWHQYQSHLLLTLGYFIKYQSATKWDIVTHNHRPITRNMSDWRWLLLFLIPTPLIRLIVNCRLGSIKFSQPTMVHRLRSRDICAALIAQRHFSPKTEKWRWDGVWKFLIMFLV